MAAETRRWIYKKTRANNERSRCRARKMETPKDGSSEPYERQLLRLPESYRYSRRHSAAAVLGQQPASSRLQAPGSRMCAPLQLPFHFRSGFTTCECARARDPCRSAFYLADSRQVMATLRGIRERIKDLYLVLGEIEREFPDSAREARCN